jgi:hypothetical protein
MRNLHRALSSVFLAALLGASLSPGLAAQTSAAGRLAPADEYFGPLKMSVLGMRNVLRDEAAKLASANPPAPAAAFAHANLVERSVLDWEAKYPADHWLPRTILGLERLFGHIPSAESRQHAGEVATWLMTRYPNSPEAVQARSEVAESPAGPGRY